jgi:hypothetical protein
MSHRPNHATTIEWRLDRDAYTTAIAGKFLNAWKPENDPPHFDRWAIFNSYIDPGYYDASMSMASIAEWSMKVAIRPFNNDSAK